MTLVHPLLEDWRRRLETAFELAEVDARSAWFWRMRAKVLRYLIARYGERPASEIAEVPPERRTPAFVDLPSEPSRPLKSSAAIRAILERIARSN